MDFDRLLDGAKIAGDLFVQFSSHDIFEHFPLTRCERGQTRADFGKFVLLPRMARSFSVIDAIQAADLWMADHHVGTGVRANSTTWQAVASVYNTLYNYNEANLCAPHLP
jgi:hypothetical protein